MTDYKWKAKYGGMGVSEGKWLKGLEEETARLKQLLAAALKDLLGKCIVRPATARFSWITHRLA